MHPKVIQVIVVVIAVIALISVGSVIYMVSEQNMAVASYTQQVEDLWELYGDMVERYDEAWTDYTKAQADYDELSRELNASEWMEMEATAYTIDDASQGTNNINALGWDLHDARSTAIPQVAVDPNIIPLNSFIEIKGMGMYVASDTGGLINGYRVDILMPDKGMAMEFGRQCVYVRVVDKGITIK